MRDVQSKKMDGDCAVFARAVNGRYPMAHYASIIK